MIELTPEEIRLPSTAVEPPNGPPLAFPLESRKPRAFSGFRPVCTRDLPARGATPSLSGLGRGGPTPSLSGLVRGGPTPGLSGLGRGGPDLPLRALALCPGSRRAAALA